ncbi:microcin immunity protein [Listeria floridensis FSL S10-1187]|uniref:Microcin immunity protein n=1 Tax=Listeria floridensis FSL S10-1187 TaxID=1265817 RepID=A0ABN0RCV8_9LIST|nr:S66 peptidase family protein [Listeria floridensis]EUJ27443.1 microcin immunity protein [Listeria floridensis FSL S10-1187]
MLNLTKPSALKRGDKVATVSLSWGGAGDTEFLWRYEQGSRRLRDLYDLEVVAMPHTLAGSETVYEHPEKRAADLMTAFADPSIKAIFSCIGGNDSIRMLPFLDFELMRANPKIFVGYSDSTITHLACLKAGISSFYGPAILSDWAENIQLPTFTADYFWALAFEAKAPLTFDVSDEYTAEFLPWLIENRDIARKFTPNMDGYEVVQGEHTVSGPLLGGCLEVLEMAKGTALFPQPSDFDDAILFLETSEEMPPPWWFEDTLRNYGAQGLLNRVNGMIFGKPQSGKYYDDYRALVVKVLNEFGLAELPVFFNASFGHNEPKITLPYGRMAELSPENRTFKLLETAVE